MNVRLFKKKIIKKKKKSVKNKENRADSMVKTVLKNSSGADDAMIKLNLIDETISKVENKSLIEILIEKGVFSEREFIGKVNKNMEEMNKKGRRMSRDILKELKKLEGREKETTSYIG